MSVILWLIAYGLIHFVFSGSALPWLHGIVLLCYFALLIAVLLRRGKAKAFGLCLPRWSPMLLLIAVYPLCQLLLGGLTLPEPKDALLIVCWGFGEELLFHGWLPNALRHTRISESAEALLIAGLFAAAHLLRAELVLPAPEIQLVTAFALGYLWSVLHRRCGSLFPAFAAHIFINLTASPADSRRLILLCAVSLASAAAVLLIGHFKTSIT